MNWRMSIRATAKPDGWLVRFISNATDLFFIPILLCVLTALPMTAQEKDKSNYGEGLVVSIPLSENEVEKIVAEVTQSGVIRGTREYNRDEFISGAKAVTSTSVFPSWNRGGKVFYKVRKQAIDPRNFKDGTDAGTVAVRYVLQPQGDNITVLRIDALFREDFRHVIHQSNGSVESAEYKDIQEHLQALEVMKKQNIQAERERQEHLLTK